MALFLHTLADDALKVCNSFQFNTDENAKTVSEIIDKYEAFTIGEVNETYERFMFNKCCQEDGEKFDHFYSDLRSLIKTCGYCDNCNESMLRDRIVFGVRERTVQTDLLKVRKLTLDRCIDICKASENASAQNRVLRPNGVSVNKVNLHKSKAKKYGKEYTENGKSKSFPDSEKKLCKFCGYNHVLKKEKCPVYGKIVVNTENLIILPVSVANLMSMSEK